jgi:hypothetical protein
MKERIERSIVDVHGAKSDKAKNTLQRGRWTFGGPPVAPAIEHWRDDRPLAEEILKQDGGRDEK